MNLIGYYGSDEIWIPDPISEEKIYSSIINNYKKDADSKETNNWSQDYKNKSPIIVRSSINQSVYSFGVADDELISQ